MEQVDWKDVKPSEDKIQAAKEAVKKLVGETIEAAKDWLERHGVAYRVLDNDVKYDMQHDESRVNLKSEDGKVTEIHLG